MWMKCVALCCALNLHHVPSRTTWKLRTKWNSFIVRRLPFGLFSVGLPEGFRVGCVERRLVMTLLGLPVLVVSGFSLTLCRRDVARFGVVDGDDEGVRNCFTVIGFFVVMWCVVGTDVVLVCGALVLLGAPGVVSRVLLRCFKIASCLIPRWRTSSEKDKQ